LADGTLKKNKKNGVKFIYMPKDGKFEGYLTWGHKNCKHVIYFYEKGNVYVGEMDTKNGVREGHGTMYAKSGNRYRGEWVNSKMQGYGTYLYNTGVKYVGDFINNRYEGEGALYMLNGNKYRGEGKNVVLCVGKDTRLIGHLNRSQMFLTWAYPPIVNCTLIH